MERDTITNAELGAVITLPEVLTYRKLLKYDEAVELMQKEGLYVRLWAGVKAIIPPEDWKCEAAGLDLDLEAAVQPGVLEVVKWAGLALFSWVREQRELPKNL